jgi:hypothetical protein
MKQVRSLGSMLEAKEIGTAFRRSEGPTYPVDTVLATLMAHPGRWESMRKRKENRATCPASRWLVCTQR